MQHGIRQFFVSRPLWQTVPVIVAISIASSLGALFLLTELMGMSYGPAFARSLTIATVAPALVSAPIGGFIVHLLREVERARREALLMSWRDELTGLLNRRRLVEVGARELTLVHRSQRRLVAMLMDIDDFKRINDQHGHAAGDAVLRAVAKILPGQLRGTDLTARWGGEEFALVLPDIGLADAALLADRLRSAIESLKAVVPGGAILQCTVSIGITEARDGDGLDSLIDRADQAMYLAKAGGKNRVVQAG